MKRLVMLLFLISFVSAPVAVPSISSLSPLDPLAGSSVNFSSDVSFEGNASLVYEWSFGDNETAQTSVPYVVHTYANVGNYTLSLKVIPGGNSTLSSVRNFSINTLSPGGPVDNELSSKKASLANVRAKIEGFSAWYEDDLLGFLEIVSFEEELTALELARSVSTDVEALLNIKEDVSALDIPLNVWRKVFESSFLIPDPSGVDIAPVAEISGESVSGTNEDYVNAILGWQEDNVNVSMEFKNVFSSYSDRDEVSVLSVYSFDITSRGKGKSYFVIGVPLDELHFKSDVGAREAGDFTVVILDEGKKKLIEFYYMDTESASFFVSPKLSSLAIETDIIEGCNFNNVCEENLGEDSSNCRNDCKPVTRAIWFFIVGLVVLLLVYTGFQIWYKRHYEAYLFRDRAQMYNLLMYVTNARARGIKDNRIGAELRAKGWSSERVNYVIRKSSGKSTGMIEIIPIEFVASLLRKRKAKKVVGTTTAFPRQNNANINKSKARI